MAENTEEQGEQKSSKKLIIIIGVVVLLLSGGGAAFFLMGGEEEATEEVEEVEEQPEEQASDLLYYDMAKSFIVNYPKGSSASLVQVSITLLVGSEETIEAIKKHEPMIRNNILMLMSAQDTQELVAVEGKEKLRTSMLEEINKVMQKMSKNAKADNLFFTAFVMQ